MQIDSTIRQKVIDIMSDKITLPNAEHDIDSFRFLDSGQIDSFSLVQLIMDVEEEFEIEFSTQDTQSDEFRYIGGLVNIISMKS